VTPGLDAPGDRPPPPASGPTLPPPPAPGSPLPPPPLLPPPPRPETDQVSRAPAGFRAPSATELVDPDQVVAERRPDTSGWFSPTAAVEPANGDGGPPAGPVKAVARRYGAVVVVVVALVVLGVALPSVVGSPGAPPAARQLTITPAAAPGTRGVTVTGAACGPGVRQVAWSDYAPICEPAWHGNNGGATAPGVTRSTITLTFREASPAEAAQLGSLIPASVSGSSQETVLTMEADIKTFNQDFELYGRHVVLKPYVGEGDFVAELSGEGKQLAARDAAAAARLHAFADSSGLDATPVYESALAARHILGLGVFDGPDTQFLAGAPYLYTTGNVCSKTAQATVQLVARSLAPTPVQFAGGGLNGGKRTFGLVDTNAGTSNGCGQAIVSELKAKDGVTVKRVVHLSLDAPSFQAQVQTAVKELDQAGVTTVLCTTCDPFTPIFLTKAADALGYQPEWVESAFLDSLAALQTPSQALDAIGLGQPSVAATGTEAEYAFDAGAPAGATMVPDFAQVYGPLLLLFDALQAAGPDLTPATFQRGLANLPPSAAGGMFGDWAFGPGSVDPNAAYGVVRWSSTLQSPVNEAPGSWQACNGGVLYPYSGMPPQLPEGEPLQCSTASSSSGVAPGAGGGNAGGAP